MLKKLLIVLVVVLFFTIYVSYSLEEKSEKELPKSIELVGVSIPRQHGLDGSGVNVGIIDTGIDFNHPDLLGYGPSGKVAGGYDYINSNEKPIDTNGHGTEVAGIIGASGNFSGMAPNSKLYSYKVSATGESVSSDFIIKAITRAIEDKVSVINISLGVNKTNNDLDHAVDKAVKQNVVVVTAAGNNGPAMKTIGSPGNDINAITVGASYNNITSSLVATLEIEKKHYQVLPMLGNKPLSEPVVGKLVYGSYGREKDLQNLDLNGAIVLEERGSDVKGEKVYFAEKEQNAANRGAKGLIVFNNQSGIFFGELKDPNSNSYYPRIPVISISKDDGLKIKSMLTNSTNAALNLFYHPDFVASFSSRGPVSPFYIKPDLVAPGVFVNTTSLDGKFNLTSGTSLSAPHVTGAVAMLLQEHPNLDPLSIASLISTTTDPVTDAYGKIFPIDVAGSGRLNVTRAYLADLVLIPHSLVFNISYDIPSQTKDIHIRSIDDKSIPKLRVNFSSNEPSLIFDYSIDNDIIHATIKNNSKKPGDYDGFITIDDSNITYRIPVIIHLTRGTIKTTQNNGEVGFSIDYPGKWSYAKITLIKATSYDDDTKTTSITPETSRTITVHDTGQYWIEAQIKTENGTDNAYKTIEVKTVGNLFDFEDVVHLPIKQTVIIVSVLITIVIIGLVVRSRKD